jgi:Kef-type K+ transport system membrane component KefB
VRESRARGPFAQTLLGVVAVDDALGLLLFALLLGLAQGATGAGEAGGLLLTALRDVGGAVVLGAALGVPMAYLTGRVTPGDPTLAEALGGVLLCCGLALWLEVSFLIASMTLGAVVANFARHHVRPFHAVENVEWPFVTFFFPLAGASLRIDTLWTLGALVPAYVALRVLGRLVGALAGGAPVGWPVRRRLWMGAALLPQAGVAVGMALVAAEALPELGAAVVPVTIASTVLFELAGPVFTRLALGAVGEVPRAKPRG